MLVYLIFTVPQLNPPSAVGMVFAEKKIGPWHGCNTMNADQIFNGPAKYATAQVDTGIGQADGSAGSMADGVICARDFGLAAKAFNRPEIEISVIYAFGGAIDREESWTYFTNTVLPEWQKAYPTIKYVGMEGEFACHINSGCPDATKWNNNYTWRKSLVDRLTLIVTPLGFSVLNHLVEGESVSTMPWMMTKATTFPTGGDPASVIDPNSAWARTTNDNWVGGQIGVLGPPGGADGVWNGSYKDACGCFWQKYVIDGVIDAWHQLRAQHGHFLFLGGSTVGYGSQGIWEDFIFQQWVMDRQRLYPEFTWVGEGDSPPPSPPPLPPPPLFPFLPYYNLYILFTIGFIVGFLPFIVFSLTRRGRGSTAPPSHKEGRPRLSGV